MAESHKIPEWLESKLFENVLRQCVPDFKAIKDFKAFNALPPGENYATVMLRIQIEVLLLDESTLAHNLMMKVAHDSEFYRVEMTKFNMFAIESLMYRDVVPELEKLYTDVGVNVHFSPKAYKLPIEKEYILLEDLKQHGFRNAIRQNGLDMEHCRSVLKKLAQWHAASAVRVERKGLYDSQCVKGIANDAGIELLRSAMANCVKNVLNSAKTIDKHEIYIDQMEKLGNRFVDELFKESALVASDFNVLNHGDCWCNNIMFQYDEGDKLRETYFVDLQVPRYGTPAQDLLYFILTSSQLDLKITHFDELIKYYYDNLIANLKLLKYSKRVPSLGDIHGMLIKAGKWAVFATWNVMPAVLADSSKDANVENLVGDSEESQKFKDLLYNNERIKSHYAQVLPWLYYRGAFDFE